MLTAADSLTSFISNPQGLQTDWVIPLHSIASIASPTPGAFLIRTCTTAHYFVADSRSQASCDSWRSAIQEARKPTPVAPIKKLPSAPLPPPSVVLPKCPTEALVQENKEVLRELDLVLQAVVGLQHGAHRLRQQFGVELTSSAAEQETLLEQLGLAPTQAPAARSSLLPRSLRTMEVIANANAMFTRVEAQQRQLLLNSNPQTHTDPRTLGQIAENTRRLAAVSLMLNAVHR